jgi:hypothetical protein
VKTALTMALVALAALPGAAQTPRPDFAPLRATVKAFPARVASGHDVVLTYTVVNSGKAPFPIVFASGKQFDMVVTSGVGAKTVYQASAGMMYTMMLSRMTLAPGEKRTFTETWHIAPGTSSGAYNVHAFLTPQGTLPFGANAGAVPATTRVTVAPAR